MSATKCTRIECECGRVFTVEHAVEAVEATEPQEKYEQTQQVRYIGPQERKLAEAKRIVEAACGPAPSPDCVPVLGYTTANGVIYPPRWRSKPDCIPEHKLKR